MYAIIDIETTGGSPSNSKITEIAIILHDGEKVVKEYSTLINPETYIPYQITQLTGISNAMVEGAPLFHEVAKEIVEMTEGAVFVAHNVKFDYSFVQAAFKDLGYNFHRSTLCTVRLSRKAFPGYKSYSLGEICRELNIRIENRHRALGDALATAELFSQILKTNAAVIDEVKDAKSKTSTYIPPLLKEDALDRIPTGLTGVYYFHNQLGDVIYVGKSNDIRKRITQHFASPKTKKSIRMLDELAHISIENTGSELIALLLESDEIKKLKPIYNTSQKRSSAIPYYSIYHRTDEQGYIELYIDRYQEDKEVLTTVDSSVQAKKIFEKAVEQYQLCLSKCNLHKFAGPCFNYQIKKCLGACVSSESPEKYNERAMAAIESMSFQNKNFLLISKGRVEYEKSIVCIEQGQYKGFGFFDASFGYPSIDDLRSSIKKYPHNRDIQMILARYMNKCIIMPY